MNKAIKFAAMLATMHALSANAGFVDETEKPANVPAATAAQPMSASRLVLSKGYETPLWDKPIAPQTGPIPLAMALAVLLPPDLPGVVMTPDAAVETHMASWDTGLTRRQAMERIIPAGRTLTLSDGVATLEAERPTRGAQVLPLGQSIVVPAAPLMTQYDAGPGDKTIRQVIARWSKSAQWSFEDAYWDLARDVPVVAAASFSQDFKGSVIALLKTTEVTDLPAKPCFYTNKVVRVVSKSEKCDKTKE